MSDAGVSGEGRGTELVDDQVAQTKGERTRLRLLELAIERFGTKGFKATSVSEIARAAGLTQAAVYAYFDNKDALFDAAVDADAASAIQAATDRVQLVPAAQLAPLLLALLMGDLPNHPLAHRVLAGREPEALQRLINLPALAELADLIRIRVAEAQETGDVRSDVDPQVFADGAESIILSLLMAVSQIGQSTEARRQLGIVSIFDLALRPPPA